MAFAAGAAMTMAQALPEYPEKVDLTLNGQKELPGVTVTQTMEPYDGDDYLTVTITGECDADLITLDIATPEGWDGLLVRSDYTEESEDIEPLKAKAPAKDDEDLWMDTSMALWFGVEAGNTITFPVDGEEWRGMALLVKGEEAYMVNIDFIFEVKKEGGNVSADEPKYPQSLDFTLNGEKELSGVSVSQKMVTNSGTDYLTIEISGESSADAITMDFETPKGWDYALIASMIDGGDAPFNTRSGDSKKWYPVGDVIAMGYKKGNSFEFPVDGKDSFGTIYLVKGDKVWEDSIDILINVKKSEGAGDDPVVDAPAFPDHLDYTLNGEKELPDITVRQLLDGTTNVFSVKGKCDSDYITVTFDTPEGWDGLMIADAFGEGEISTVKTRGVDLIPVKDILGQGFKEGNTITYMTNGEAQWGNIALIKGDMACLTFIDYDITVSKSEGGDEPGDEPVLPESFVVTTFNEGLSVWQGMEYGSYTIKVEGEVTANTFPVVIDVPEGWDGFISYVWSYDEVIITESNEQPKRTRAEEIEWIPLSDFGPEFVKGNKFVFQPTFVPGTGQYQTVEMYLYKGDMAVAEYYCLEIYVSKGEAAAPTFPEKFNITTNNGVTATQTTVSELPEGTLDEMEEELAGMFYCDNTVLISGTTSDKNVTVDFELPEGWTGVQPFKFTLPNFDDFEYYKTRANESEWQILDDVKASFGGMFGYFDTSIEGSDKFEFNTNEKQVYMCYLYTEMTEGGETYTLADTANPFLLVVDVKNGEAPALAFPEKFDIQLSCEGLSVTQELEEYEGEEEFTITIEGKCAEDKLTVTVDVPEGWDGFVGTSDEDYESDIMPYSTRSVDNEDMWMPVEIFEQFYGYKRVNTFTFSIDGEDHAAMLFLYKDEMAYACPIYINVEVEPAGTGIETVDSAADARYYDLQGTEVANPQKGVYVKVANGKASKVVVK